MKRLTTKAVLFLGALLCLGASSIVHAQATRTWVSGVGDDANPCSRTAPCKTFAGAISKTAAGGIINTIDSGGYGAVTITKSITIDGGGNLASILSSGTTGVIINTAAATDIVVLRGLVINGGTTGIHGVRFISPNGGSVLIENTIMHGFTTNGIEVSSAVLNGKLTARNVRISGAGTGVNVASATSVVTLDTVAISNSTTGINAAAGNISLRNSDLTQNTTAIVNGGGTLSSAGDNMLAGNGSNGAAANVALPAY